MPHIFVSRYYAYFHTSFVNRIIRTFFQDLEPCLPYHGCGYLDCSALRLTVLCAGKETSGINRLPEGACHALRHTLLFNK